MSFETIAEKLNLPVSFVQKESMRHYLEKKLLETQTELFALASKYKIKSVKEFDRLIKIGKIHETPETREDFFRIDNLTNQIALIKQLLTAK